MVTLKDKFLAFLIHALPFISIFIHATVPIIVSLLLVIFLKGKNAYLYTHAKSAFNFVANVSVLFWLVFLTIMVNLSLAASLFAILYSALVISWLFFLIFACVRIFKNQEYYYIRLFQFLK